MLRWKLTTLTVLAMGLVSASLARATYQNTTDMFLDDFNDATINAEWTLTSSPELQTSGDYAGSVKINSNPSPADKLVNSAVLATPNADGKLSVLCDVTCRLYGNNNGFVLYLGRNSTDTVRIQLVFDSTTSTISLKNYSSGAWQLLCSGLPNFTKFRLIATLDTLGNTYRIVVKNTNDQVLFSSGDVTAYKTFPESGNVYILAASTGTNTGQASYLDKIIVGPVPADAPTFSPAGGSYTSPQTVTITCDTPGAVIRYTDDGTDPTDTNGTVIANGDSITVDHSLVLKARATASGYIDSLVRSDAYDFGTPFVDEFSGTTIDPAWTQTNTPTLQTSGIYAGSVLIDREGGVNDALVAPEVVISPDAQGKITMSCDVMCRFYSSCTFSFYLGRNGTPTVYCGLKREMDGTLNLVNYTAASGWVTQCAGLPNFATLRLIVAVKAVGPDNNTYQVIVKNFNNEVLFTSGDITASAAFPASQNGTVYLTTTISGAGGNVVYLDRVSVGEAVPVDNPIFSLPDGSYTGPQTVTITCDTPGAVIRYTDDGTIPTDTNGTLIDNGSSILVDRTMTLKARATASGYTPSGTQSATYAFPYVGGDVYEKNIVIDGDLSDWPASSEWTTPYVYWAGTGPSLNSTTRARFAWNDAQDVLYVAVQTNESVLQAGGHMALGFSKDIASVPTSGIGSTQLAFDIDNTTAHDVIIMNEIQWYMDTFGQTTWGGGVTDGVQAKYSSAGGTWIYEVAVPLWNDWRPGQERVAQPLSAGDTIYLFACMEDTLDGGNGTDLSFYGRPANPSFGTGHFERAAALTLVAPSADIPGDANGDGMVDVGDLGILAANYGGSGKTWAQGDFNNDGLVDVGDLGILAAHYGEGVNGSVDFAADYAKAFGTTVEDDSADETGSSICSGLGLPIIAGLALLGLMLVKLEE